MRRALCAVALALIALSAFAAGPRIEVEPNDVKEKAMPIKPGETVIGMVHYNDQNDFYALQFDADGEATIVLSDMPADTAFQVGRSGFDKALDYNVGWEDGKAGRRVVHTFKVKGGKPGVVWVRLASIRSGLATNTWCGVRCSDTGPWYVTPKYNQQVSAPAQHNGVPVKGPVTYKLTVVSGQAPADPDAGKAIALDAKSAGDATANATGEAVVTEAISDPEALMKSGHMMLVGQFIQAVHTGNERVVQQLAEPAFGAAIQKVGLKQYYNDLFFKPPAGIAPIGVAAMKDGNVLVSLKIVYQTGSVAQVLAVVRNGKVASLSTRLGSRKQ